MTTQRVVTRFAPSPTGTMHIGNLRTAIFSWLWARANSGDFFIRIEDTDKVRSTKENEENIFRDLDWMEMTAEGIYRQSDRLDLYQDAAKELVKRGIAVKRDGAVWIEFEQDLSTRYTAKDFLRGDIAYPTKDLPPIVLMKRDGYPTYHFAHVIDDNWMGVTHVMRGDEYLSTFPYHKRLYELLGYKLPTYIHLPLILNENGVGKLSKRKGGNGDVRTTVEGLRQSGYLPDAIWNYLSLLGWRQPYADEEILDKDLLIHLFDIKDIGTSPSRIDWKKLDFINAHYIRKGAGEGLELLSRMESVMPMPPLDTDTYLRTLPYATQRAFTLFDVRKGLEPFGEGYHLVHGDFDEPKGEMSYSEVELVAMHLKHIDTEWTEDTIHEMLSNLHPSHIKAKHFYGTLRMALVGTAVTYGVHEIMYALGVKETLRRLLDYAGR